MKSSGMFQWLLSCSLSWLLVPALEHKQVLVGRRQWLKLQLIICTNHGPRKHWFEKPKFFDFITFLLLSFCNKHYCNFLVLARAHGGKLSLIVSSIACSRPVQDVLVLPFASWWNSVLPLMPGRFLSLSQVRNSIRCLRFCTGLHLPGWVWYSNAYCKLFIVLLTLWHD